MSGLLDDTVHWQPGDKLRLYGQLRHRLWQEQARFEQLPPEGDWRVWYLQGGRGSGKSRTGAETLAGWIDQYPGGEWAIVAPTFADARDTCTESQDSGIIPILGPRVRTYNRSLGEIMLHDGAKVFLDGADDGALRIQGRNLKGAWADEVGLWRLWDKAWNESLAFALRHPPSRIVATGTPKMGHGLVRALVEDDTVPKSRMSMQDNLANLNPAAVADLYNRYANTRLGAQELDGDWIAAIEGDMLKRSWWRYYNPEYLGSRRRPGIQTGRLPAFTLILMSLDTPLKDKETSDFVALQAWGVHGADRYLLDTRVERMSYDTCKRAVRDMAQHMRSTFRNAQHRVLIENAGYGSDLIIDLKREITGVLKQQANKDGNKTMRALAASADLESGNCFLPGRALPDMSGPDEQACPHSTIHFVNELALFDQGDHDDQVDAWSQAMNYLRSHAVHPLRTSSALRTMRRTLTPRNRAW